MDLGNGIHELFKCSKPLAHTIMELSGMAVEGKRETDICFFREVLEHGDQIRVVSKSAPIGLKDILLISECVGAFQHALQRIWAEGRFSPGEDQLSASPLVSSLHFLHQASFIDGFILQPG